MKSWKSSCLLLGFALRVIHSPWQKSSDDFGYWRLSTFAKLQKLRLGVGEKYCFSGDYSVDGIILHVFAISLLYYAAWCRLVFLQTSHSVKRDIHVGGVGNLLVIRTILVAGWILRISSHNAGVSSLGYSTVRMDPLQCFITVTNAWRVYQRLNTNLRARSEVWDDTKCSFQFPFFLAWIIVLAPQPKHI